MVNCDGQIPDICLTGEEKPRKTSPKKLVPTGDRTRARCVADAHATACSTAVPAPQRWTDLYDILFIFYSLLFREA